MNQNSLLRDAFLEARKRRGLPTEIEAPVENETEILDADRKEKEKLEQAYFEKSVIATTKEKIQKIVDHSENKSDIVEYIMYIADLVNYIVSETINPIVSENEDLLNQMKKILETDRKHGFCITDVNQKMRNDLIGYLNKIAEITKSGYVQVDVVDQSQDAAVARIIHQELNGGMDSDSMGFHGFHGHHAHHRYHGHHGHHRHREFDEYQNSYDMNYMNDFPDPPEFGFGEVIGEVNGTGQSVNHVMSDAELALKLQQEYYM